MRHNSILVANVLRVRISCPISQHHILVPLKMTRVFWSINWGVRWSHFFWHKKTSVVKLAFNTVPLCWIILAPTSKAGTLGRITRILAALISTSRPFSILFGTPARFVTPILRVVIAFLPSALPLMTWSLISVVPMVPHWKSLFLVMIVVSVWVSIAWCSVIVIGIVVATLTFSTSSIIVTIWGVMTIVLILKFVTRHMTCPPFPIPMMFWLVNIHGHLSTACLLYMSPFLVSFAFEPISCTVRSFWSI